MEIVKIQNELEERRLEISSIARISQKRNGHYQLRCRQISKCVKYASSHSTEEWKFAE